MKPDNATLYAWQNIYEPLPAVDGTWVIFYSIDGKWRQTSKPTKEDAYAFYEQKVNEFKQAFMNKGMSK